MAPINTIKTSTIEECYEKDVNCKHCDEDHSLKSSNLNNNTITLCDKIRIYEEVLPKNDPKFMAPIREWEKKVGFVTPLMWKNIITIGLFHIIALIWSTYYFASGKTVMWQSTIFGLFMGGVAGFGVTGGVHRLYTHRSYKATKPLQIILLLCYAAAGQNKVFDWVRDHRMHHKFSDTSADPHNVTRGFLFSHVGWLLMKKHPDVKKEGNKIDMSDITTDPYVNFFSRYFWPIQLLICFIIPCMIPVYCWGENWETAIMSQVFIRYICSLNFTWSVNSFAHRWGNKPYDVNIHPSENWGVSIIAMGEGWHNYHHSFPWDYKSAELAYTLNITTLLLDLFAKIGWVYDRKVASKSLIQSVIKNRGASH